MEVFTERGLYRTQDGTGILILLSAFEHRAVILGDHGIHDKVGNEGWQEHAGTIAQAIRRGEAAVGVTTVLEALAPLLSELAPRRHNDTNELANTVVDLDL